MLGILCIVLIVIIIFLMVKSLRLQDNNRELKLDNHILHAQIENMLKEK